MVFVAGQQSLACGLAAAGDGAVVLRSAGARRQMADGMFPVADQQSRSWPAAGKGAVGMP